MAIRPRKTWMTRLYLVTRSNTGQRPERKCEFYRTNGIEGLVDDAHRAAPPSDPVTPTGTLRPSLNPRSFHAAFAVSRLSLRTGRSRPRRALRAHAREGRRPDARDREGGPERRGVRPGLGRRP